jgi:hypothetical protein
MAMSERMSRPTEIIFLSPSSAAMNVDYLFLMKMEAGNVLLVFFLEKNH